MSFKVREAHWEIIIQFLEDHRDLATGRFSGPTGKISQKKLWTELATNLNSLGLGERSPDKWQKTWVDYKYLLKKKAIQKKKDLDLTGGGLATSTPFSELELRILSLLGDTFYQGVNSSEVVVTNVQVREPQKIPFREVNQPKSSPILPVVTEHKNILFWKGSEPCNESKLPVLPGVSPKVSEPKKKQLEVNEPSSSSYVHDHNYLPTPKKQKKKDNMEEAYEETINVLNEIKDVVASGLNQIAQNIFDLKEAIIEMKT